MAGDDEKPSRSIRDQSLLVYSRCPNKRTRRDTPSSASSPESSNFSLNDHEVLLTEVLQRLPTAKSVFLCKCVCKKWYSLISTPFFTRRFIAHHLKLQYKQNPSPIIINYSTENYNFGRLTIPDKPMFKSRGFELNNFSEKHGWDGVSAIFNDLMLCEKYQYGMLHYYICNPFTMQWVPLPPLEVKYVTVKGIKEGFVCDPYYFEDSQGECTINCSYRFRVVLFLEQTESDQLIVRTFCSETKKWNTSYLEGSEYGGVTDVVAYNGKLHWYNYNRKDIFAYDPFNPELSTFINCSSIQHTELPARRHIGVFQGFLRLMELVDSGTSCQTLAIWKLEDYNNGEWSLEEKVSLDAMIPESSLVQTIAGGCELHPLAFHPCDGDIVYFHLYVCVISCNTRTKELKMDGKILNAVGCNFHSHGKVFIIEPPLWPTPIGTPIEIVPCN